MMDSPLLLALAQRVLVFDGAMGTQVQAAGLTLADYSLSSVACPSDAVRAAIERHGDAPLEGCTEVLNLTRPDVIEAIHGRYLAAGADLIETNSFGSTAIVLADYGVPELVEVISRAAAAIARRAADKASTPERPRFVVGALGPGTKLVSLEQTTWQALEETYATSARALIEGGADAILLETLQDLLMVKAGVVAVERAMAEAGRQVPIFVQVTMEQTGTMLVGSELAAAVNMLEAFPSVCAIGINCATGPREMAPHVRFLSENSTRPISVQPNAGLPVMEGGKAVYKLTPAELARHHAHFVNDLGAAMVGGCCGSTPEHIRAVAEAVGGQPHRSHAHWMRCRSAFPGFDFRVAGPEQAEAFALVGCSSLYQFVPYLQENSFFIIGEKTNANGSKAFRNLLAEENWDALTELARELEAEGSNALDVCTAFVGRDEVRDLRTLLSLYNRHVTAPVMIDSTEAPAIEAALQTVAGKPIVNSINLEDGGARADRVLALCRRYGAAVVALVIDETGMAKTAARKVEVADRLMARTRAAGLPDHDVFVDCLTFTLGSGDEEYRKAAVETLDAIREVRRRYPHVNAVLGVSNVSFGLRPPARMALNSAFLHHALEAGLTAAIVHYSKIRPQNRIDPDIWGIASDLVFDRRRYNA